MVTDEALFALKQKKGRQWRPFLNLAPEDGLEPPTQ
jgi:hypothetical protein